MWMNVACLVGRVASDPKARTTAGGTNYATLRIAVPKGRGKTDFFTVELWGKLAQVALDRVRTGGIVSLRCELDQQQWGPDGERKERVALVVRKLGLISSNSTIVFGETEADDLDQQDEERAA
jgi:single-strand DNA-binding protein